MKFAAPHKALILMAFLMLHPFGAGAHLQVTCPDKSNLNKVSPDYVQTVGEELQRATGATSVKCTSCKRSVEEQKAACKRICGNEGGCPGLCAPPGKSQHQKENIAVCDLQGIPGGAKAGCEALKKICVEKYQGRCGVGGYGSGAHHFGAGDNHFSAWNQCGYLKGTVQAGDAQGQAAAQAEADLYQELANPIFDIIRGENERGEKSSQIDYYIDQEKKAYEQQQKQLQQQNPQLQKK